MKNAIAIFLALSFQLLLSVELGTGVERNYGDCIHHCLGKDTPKVIDADLSCNNCNMIIASTMMFIDIDLRLTFHNVSTLGHIPVNGSYTSYWISQIPVTGTSSISSPIGAMRLLYQKQTFLL